LAPVVRAGVAGDAASICAIYNQGIEERIATFETRLRTPADIEGWFSPGALPVVVAEEDSRVLGFASSSSYSTRECYNGIREFSIYVDRKARGKGLSRLLLLALSEATVRSGGWKLTSRIFPENVASLEACRAAGFRVVGTHFRHAKLDGVWRDVVTIEKLLDQD
jgi:L-amino acid N-acyltransferase YncA